MACTNCFNGCTETISDQCIKYTGIDIPELGIQNGDSLAAIETIITTFLSSIIVGTGINPIISPSDICSAISNNLPVCTECDGFTLNDILTAIIKAVCDLNLEVNTINSTLNTLNAEYIPKCLTGVVASSDTHDILQAVIDKLCSLNSSFTALLLTLPLTYVSISSSPGVLGINDYIAAYLATSSSKAKDKMIPYCPIPYVGALSNYPSAGDSFSVSGVGSGYWDKVYLCNGLNTTPDLRGRILPGVVTGMGGSTYNGAVDPANPANPNYILGTLYGANTVTLGLGQMPNHSHTGSTVTITDPGHYHNVANGDGGTTTLLEGTPYLSYAGNRGDENSYWFMGTDTVPDRGRTDTKTTGITAAPTIAAEGSGGAHNNIQPVYATYYIIYIP
tara:strand:- start:43309 stop:44478 length:1170 start_codon:yes stop_codon:yes gene_type:complete